MNKDFMQPVSILAPNDQFIPEDRIAAREWISMFLKTVEKSYGQNARTLILWITSLPGAGNLRSTAVAAQPQLPEPIDLLGIVQIRRMPGPHWCRLHSPHSATLLHISGMLLTHPSLCRTEGCT